MPGTPGRKEIHNVVKAAILSREHADPGATVKSGEAEGVASAGSGDALEGVEDEAGNQQGGDKEEDSEEEEARRYIEEEKRFRDLAVGKSVLRTRQSTKGIGDNPTLEFRKAELGVDEITEEMQAKMRAVPTEPSKEERDRHNATHTPFREWCDICLKAKALD